MLKKLGEVVAKLTFWLVTVVVGAIISAIVAASPYIDALAKGVWPH